ncbi:hypothetical protein ACWGIU_38230, partial [Streptomyces sp. NPDC054840]
MPAQESGQVRVALGEGGEPLLPELADLVQVRGVQRHRRVMEGDQERELRRGVGQYAVQPGQGRRLQEAVLVPAGNGRVADGEDEALAAQHLVDGPGGADPSPSRPRRKAARSSWLPGRTTKGWRERSSWAVGTHGATGRPG